MAFSLSLCFSLRHSSPCYFIFWAYLLFHALSALHVSLSLPQFLLVESIRLFKAKSLSLSLPLCAQVCVLRQTSVETVTSVQQGHGEMCESCVSRHEAEQSAGSSYPTLSFANQLFNTNRNRRAHVQTKQTPHPHPPAPLTSCTSSCWHPAQSTTPRPKLYIRAFYFSTFTFRNDANTRNRA